MPTGTAAQGAQDDAVIDALIHNRSPAPSSVAVSAVADAARTVDVAVAASTSFIFSALVFLSFFQEFHGAGADAFIEITDTFPLASWFEFLLASSSIGRL